MENAMTFETDGSDQYLTHAVDDAIVMDALISAKRTLPDVRTPDFFEDIPVSHESNGRGAAPIYVTEFDAALGNNDYVFIKKLRGYIAGRYFEVENETTGIQFTRNQAIGCIMIRAFSNDVETKIQILPSIYTQYAGGQADPKGKSINDVSRTLEKSESENLLNYILVWRDLTDPTKRLRISARNGGIITDNKYDPYSLRFNLTQTVRRIIGSKNVYKTVFTTRAENNAHNVVLNNHEMGLIGLKPLGEAYFTSWSDATNNVPYEIVDPDGSNIGVAYGSQLETFGAYAGVIYINGSQPAPIINSINIHDVVSSIQTTNYEVYINNKYRSKFTSDDSDLYFSATRETVFPGSLDSGFNDRNTFVSKDSTIRKVLINEITDVWAPVYFKLSDINVQVKSIEYLEPNDAYAGYGTLIPSYERDYKFNSRAKNIARVRVSFTTKTPVFYGWKPENDNGTNHQYFDAQYNITFQPMKQDIIFIIPLSGVRVYDANTRQFDTPLFEEPYDFFQRVLKSSGMSDTTFFSKMLVAPCYITFREIFLAENRRKLVQEIANRTVTLTPKDNGGFILDTLYSTTTSALKPFN